MRTLNRAVLVVHPRPPYIDWANSQAEAETPLTREEQLTDPVAYLVPEVRTAEDAEALIESLWPALFDYELAAWSEDDETWPAERSREMFDRWFEVEIHPIVVDLASDALILEAL